MRWRKSDSRALGQRKTTHAERREDCQLGLTAGARGPSCRGTQHAHAHADKTSKCKNWLIVADRPRRQDVTLGKKMPESHAVDPGITAASLPAARILTSQSRKNTLPPCCATPGCMLLGVTCPKQYVRYGRKLKLNSLVKSHVLV